MYKRGGYFIKRTFQSTFLQNKNKTKKSQVAYVTKIKNNIQSTCIANIIKHVFVVQVEIQGLYFILAS